MKVNDFKKEMKTSDLVSLVSLVATFKKELLTLRINSSTAHVKDYSQYKKLRRNAARAMTFLRQKSS